MLFIKGDLAVCVACFVRDVSDPDGLTFYLEPDVNWDTIINSAKLQVIGFEMQPAGGEPALIAQDTSGRYIKDRYKPGVRYCLDAQVHSDTCALLV